MLTTDRLVNTLNLELLTGEEGLDLSLIHI